MPEYNLKRAHLTFWGILFVAGFLFIEFQNDHLPVDFIDPKNSSLHYSLCVATVFATLACTFAALRLPALKYFRHRIRNSKTEKALRHYTTLCTLRALLLDTTFIIGTITYFGTSYAISAKYCLLISAIAIIFCLPGQKEFHKLHTT